MTSLSRLIGRYSQIKQLSLLVPPPTSNYQDTAEDVPSQSVIVAHGSEATGKTAVISSYLAETGISYLSLQCRECITGRHLFERIVAECQTITHFGTNGDSARSVDFQRCENINAFVVALSTILDRAGRIVIVLDGIDELKDAPPSMIPALVRLGEQIPNLTTILVVRHPSPRLLRASGIPHIYFPPYSREQASAILSLNPPSIYPSGHQMPDGFTEEEAQEDNLWLWSRFCQAVWDALAKGAANDIVAFRALCNRLWRPFVQPVVDGTFGTRDFSRLVVAQKKLLQEETCLEDELLIETEEIESKPVVHGFPYYTKWLLCAAYLASFNPARMDTLYFMKSTERKRKKKGGGTAAGRQSKARKIPRHLLSPAAFAVDRLFAILHAILPHDMTSNIDLYTQIAHLHSLRLLVRSGIYSSDPLDKGAKWRVSYDWDYTLKIARSLNFDIADYVAE
ncbi:Origin recognition complex subunit 5-like protein [Elsinoe fawcettii]|nr:Origin recognition complex subunit 5-like protein [Elsinoe fawcettii]